MSRRSRLTRDGMCDTLTLRSSAIAWTSRCPRSRAWRTSRPNSLCTVSQLGSPGQRAAMSSVIIVLPSVTTTVPGRRCALPCNSASVRGPGCPTVHTSRAGQYRSASCRSAALAPARISAAVNDSSVTSRRRSATRRSPCIALVRAARTNCSPSRARTRSSMQCDSASHMPPWRTASTARHSPSCLIGRTCHPVGVRSLPAAAAVSARTDASRRVDGGAATRGAPLVSRSTSGRPRAWDAATTSPSGESEADASRTRLPHR